MENKNKKRSINSVIYLLLAVMLVSVVGVSIYTVASGRRQHNPQETGIAGGTSAETSRDTKPVTSHDTKKPDPAVTTAADSAADTAAVTTAAETKRAKETTELPASVETRYFVMPVEGSVCKEFEVDIPVYSLTMNDYRAHTGVDLAAELGSAVMSASTGIVCRVWDDPLMGRSLTVDHGDGIYTTYAGLAPETPPDIEAGAPVVMGQVIGAVGESAMIEIAEEPHVHFEMKIDGVHVNPLDYISADVFADVEYEG